ncbi:MAG TPA: DNA polymerase III subunit delta [Blastocatellia bacterium]
MSKKPPKKQSGISFTQFRRQVKEGRIDPLYLFTGEEDYLHNRALDVLQQSVDPSTRDFNVSVHIMGGDSLGTAAGSGRDSAASAIDMANMMPMMSGRRIVVVRDFEKISEREVELVMEYLKRPADTSAVVFQSPSLDQRRKLTTALLKTCTVVSLDHPSEREAGQWAEEYLKRRGCQIDAAALGNLVGLVGASMSRLAREMDKLATYSSNSRINNGMVEALVPRVRTHTSWELWEAIIKRDRRHALRLAARLLDDGEEPVLIIGALASLYRRMLLGKELINRGAPSYEVQKATGQYGERAGRFNARLMAMPRDEIIRGIRRIAQADDDLKNSVGSPRLQVEYLVAELTLPGPPAERRQAILRE